jgi:RimJ/RimL family protein N-acetyltransferase
MWRRIRKGEVPAIRHNPSVAVPELTTARLRLRAWRDSDRDAFAAMNADPAVMEHFPAPLDRAASDALLGRLIEHWTREGFGLWAVERLDDARFLGFVGLSRPPFEVHGASVVEVGWRLARNGWGEGFATEAARAALDFGFDVLGLEEIVSFTAPINARSRAVMERLGMHHDVRGDFEHPRLAPGHPLRRHVLYCLAAEAWRARRAARA